MTNFFDSIWTDKDIQPVTSGVLRDDGLWSSRCFQAVQTWTGVLQQLRSFAGSWHPLEGIARPAPGLINDAIELLRDFRERYPENPPVRAAVGPNGEIAIEWQWDGGEEYAEVELAEPNQLEAMYVPKSGRAQHSVTQLRLPTNERYILDTYDFRGDSQHDPARTATSATTTG